MSASKSFFAKHLFNDSDDNNYKVFKAHQLKEIQNKFIVLSSSHVRNLVALFKNYLSGGYINNILELKSKSHYNFIQECYFLGQIFSQKVFFFKMSVMGLGAEFGLLHERSSKVILKTLGSRLTM